MQFEPDRARVGGFAGCNRFSAAYSAVLDALRIGNPVSTEIACAAEISQLKTTYLNLLRTAERFAINGESLRISSKAGSLAFKRVTTP